MVVLTVDTAWPLVLAAVPLTYIAWSLLSKHQKKQSLSSANCAHKASLSSLSKELIRRLPGIVFVQHDAEYAKSTSSYWSKQNCEIAPQCVVIPGTDEEVSAAVRILFHYYDSAIKSGSPTPEFAVRSGGHSTVPGASNTSSGVVIDLSAFNKVTPSADGKTVTIGCGARWGQVSRKLDQIGLAVAGGRNSDVGVGGLTLGGGYSYFNPQCGFVCDNVLEYHVVLPSGESTIASANINPRLWRALQGGGNNFGIVTHLVVRAFPCTKVWSGFLYMWSWKAPAALRAFHDFVDAEPMDEKAAGPLVCISYVQQIGITLIATHLMYTKPESWPECWRGFGSIGRIWSSCKTRSLTSATDELDSISPAGHRQLHISTTIKNDLQTLTFALEEFSRTSTQLKRVKRMVWTLVVQPLHKSTMKHGRNNVLGLGDRTDNLVVVLFTAVWERQTDDKLVNDTGRHAIREIDEYARSRGTDDPFRYLNWCDGDTRPFEGYGDENLKFLQDVSREVDPTGLFQKGCVGGFKLWPTKS